MKKLSKRNTYTPTDASQVGCNCDRILNREEILSLISDSKTLDNRSEVNQSEHRKQETKQKIIIGIDSAFKTIGYSARTRTAELISGEVYLRTDIHDKLKEKQMYRRGRWFAPSMEHKIKTHLELVKKIKKLLPVTGIEIEVASFDAQKIQNPEISGIEYQQGELQGYEIREYLLEKFQRKCAYCEKIDIPLEIEHVIPSSRGGSDRVFNLTIACHKCNQKKGNKTAKEFGHPEIEEQCKKPLKAAAFMNTVRWELVLEKSHVNDAFAISKGSDQERCRLHVVKQTRRNNRSLQTNRKGFDPSIRRERYKFQPNDLVRYNGQAYPVKGVFNYGAWIRLENENGKDINSNIKNVELITYGKGLQFGF